MVDVRTLSIHRIARSKLQCKHISFSRLSSQFMVLWSAKFQSGQCAPLEIYDRIDGAQISAYVTQIIDHEPFVVPLTGSRAAIGVLNTFSVYSLDSGNLLSTARPGNPIDVHQPLSGLLVANCACTKLVFGPACSSTLHVYDALSLQLLCSLQRSAGNTSLALAQTRHDNRLVWDPYGWIISHGVGEEHGCRSQLL